MSATAGPEIDGRRARRARGRAAVIDAVIALVIEGHAPIRAVDVAARAGVSPATLFRYVDSLDDLQREAAGRFLIQNQTRFEIPDCGVGTLDERIDALVSARIGLYREILPVARFVRARSFEVETMAETLTLVRQGFRDQLAAHFATELAQLDQPAADEALATIAILTAFEAWDHQVSALGRTSDQVAATWRHLLPHLLA